MINHNFGEIVNFGYIKQGAAFWFNQDFANLDGTPLTGEAANFRCQINNEAGTLVEELTVTETAILGTYEFKSTAGTGTWVIGKRYYGDIQYDDGTAYAPQYTQTFSIGIVQPQTVEVTP